MLSMPVSLQRTCAALALVAAAPFAQADVLTFEDLPALCGCETGFVLSPYAGFTFADWKYTNVVDPAFPTQSGVVNLFTEEAATFSYTNANSISSASAFIFDGAYFSGFSGVSFELYLGGALVSSSLGLPDAGVNPYGSTFLASGYAGLVDQVKVFGAQGYYSMDNFTYHAAPIPEPETYALMALGLGVLGAYARRRNTKQ